MIYTPSLLRLRKKLNLDLLNFSKGGYPIYPFWPCLLSEELIPPLLQPLILTEEHCLLRVFTAVVFGKPAQRAAILATVAPPPGGRTFPTAMSSTSFGSILDWAMIPLKTEKDHRIEDRTRGVRCEIGGVRDRMDRCLSSYHSPFPKISSGQHWDRPPFLA